MTLEMNDPFLNLSPGPVKMDFSFKESCPCYIHFALLPGGGEGPWPMPPVLLLPRWAGHTSASWQWEKNSGCSVSKGAGSTFMCQVLRMPRWREQAFCPASSHAINKYTYRRRQTWIRQGRNGICICRWVARPGLFSNNWAGQGRKP